jgi:hypothetical protein
MGAQRLFAQAKMMFSFGRGSVRATPKKYRLPPAAPCGVANARLGGFAT